MNIVKKIFQLDVGGKKFFCPENFYEYLDNNIEINVKYYLAYKLVSLEGETLVKGMTLTIDSFPLDEDFSMNLSRDLYIFISDRRKIL